MLSGTDAARFCDLERLICEGGIFNRTSSNYLDCSVRSWSNSVIAAARTLSLAAITIGVKSRTSPKFTFPPLCHSCVRRVASKIVSPRRFGALSGYCPWMVFDAGRKLLDIWQLPLAKKCSYCVTGKFRVRWTFPGSGVGRNLKQRCQCPARSNVVRSLNFLSRKKTHGTWFIPQLALVSFGKFCILAVRGQLR